MGVYYSLVQIVKKGSQRTTSHIQQVFWGDFLVPFFFRKVSSIPITSCHILDSFFPWLSDSSRGCIKNCGKKWVSNGFKIWEILRYLTLFPSLPGLCGIVVSTWVANHDGFLPSKSWIFCFFVAPSCLYLLSRLIPVIKWIKSKWSKCRKIITTSHSCCVGKVKFAVPCMWIWWQSLNVANIRKKIYYIFIYLFICSYIYIYYFFWLYVPIGTLL